MARSVVAIENFAGTLSNWGQLEASNNTMQISGGVVRGQFSSGNNINIAGAIRWTGTGTITDDQYASIVMGNAILNGVGFVGVICRATADTDTNKDFYYYLVSCGSASTARYSEIGHVKNGARTILNTYTDTWVNGDRVELECTGTSTVTLAACKNGTMIHSETDSTSPLSGGSFGIVSNSPADVTGDDFEGGNITASAANWGRLLDMEVNRLVLTAR